MAISRQQIKNIITITECLWIISVIAINIYIWNYSSFITPDISFEQKLLTCFLLSSLAIVYILIAAIVIAYLIALYFVYKVSIKQFIQKFVQNLKKYLSYSFQIYTLYITPNTTFDLTNSQDDEDYNYSIISRKKRKNTIKNLRKRKNKTI
tara:strand:- start:4014 stop:4466 length:453 start_codon:yes stop_codon:yes gene_type:complete